MKLFCDFLKKLSFFAFLICVIGCNKTNKYDVILSDSDYDYAKKISLTFFGYKADAMNLTATEEAMQTFMMQHKDIDITYEGIKGIEYWDAFDKRDESNMLDDVFMMHHDHIVKMGAEGKLADLSKLNGVQNYSASSKSQFTNSDNSVYFLPTSISTYNLYVNYDLLNEHNQTIPTNWDEFQKTCDYFVKQGIVPIIANNRNSLTTLILCRSLYDVYQKSESEIDVLMKKFNSDPSLFSQELLPGVEMVAEMLKRGWIDKTQTLKTEQTSDDLKKFVMGVNPFMISGGWASSRVMAMKPKFTYGVYPYPILKDGGVLAMQIDTCISVNANSKNLEEAKLFVEHLISPDVMWKYCDSQASYTPLNDSRLPSEKTLVPSTEYLNNGRSVLRTDYRLNLPIESALLVCSRSLLNGDDVNVAQEILKKELQK